MASKKVSIETIDASEINKFDPVNGRQLLLVGSDDPVYKKTDLNRYIFVKEANGRIPDDYLLKSLEMANGIVSKAAEITGLSHQTYYTRMQKDSDFKEKVLQTKYLIENRKLDVAEEHLFEFVEDRNLGAIKYYLDNKGKERGYGKRDVGRGSKDNPVHIKLSLGDMEVNDEFG